ncbi:hypothetical protein GCM10020218_103310 [Dactylosporangium vinaceum]
MGAGQTDAVQVAESSLCITVTVFRHRSEPDVGDAGQAAESVPRKAGGPEPKLPGHRWDVPRD